MRKNYTTLSTLTELLSLLDRDGIQDHRRYEAVRKFLNFKARDKGIPISGSFELTPLCNLDCKMCYVHLNKQQMQGANLLSAEIWKDFMKQAIDAGMMYASLTGGECLTYPGFKDLYLFLQENGIETTILSNGILMDESMVDFFRESPPTLIQITLYGASEESYERVAGHRAFSKVLDNIKRLRDEEIPLRIAVTPNAFMDDGEDVVKLIYSLNLPCRINSGLFAPRTETGRKIEEAELSQYVKMLRQQMLLSGKDIPETCDDEMLPEVGGNGEKANGVTCGAGRSGFSVSWDGQLRPCGTFPNVAENLLQTPFKTAWQSINRQVNQFPLPTGCVGCKYYHICKHCVAEHASGAPIGHTSSAVCDWTQRMVAEGIFKL